MTDEGKAYVYLCVEGTIFGGWQCLLMREIHLICTARYTYNQPDINLLRNSIS